MNVREYTEADLPRMAEIWNQVVEDGIAFPQLEPLTLETARDFFRAQNFSAVAEEDGEIFGLYILHPNNEGRCGHIANASYAVDRASRGRGAGKALVQHCLKTAAALGFLLMQFNAVVKSNLGAIHLYEKLGFVRVGEIPGGFLMKDGRYEDIVLFYHTL